MALYKRGDTYWYQFQFNGERIQESAKTSNKDAARQIDAAHRVRLAKGQAGIVERPPAPTLKSSARGLNPPSDVRLSSGTFFRLATNLK